MSIFHGENRFFGQPKVQEAYNIIKVKDQLFSQWQIDELLHYMAPKRVSETLLKKHLLLYTSKVHPKQSHGIA